MTAQQAPVADEFLSHANAAFAFLSSAPIHEQNRVLFRPPFEAPLITAAVHFERRDQLVRCSLQRLVDTSGTKLNCRGIPNLIGYLIDEKGYRGSLKEIATDEYARNDWRSDVILFSRAIRHFFASEVPASGTSSFVDGFGPLLHSVGNTAVATGTPMQDPIAG